MLKSVSGAWKGIWDNFNVGGEAQAAQYVCPNLSSLPGSQIIVLGKAFWSPWGGGGGGETGVNPGEGIHPQRLREGWPVQTINYYSRKNNFKLIIY